MGISHSLTFAVLVVGHKLSAVSAKIDDDKSGKPRVLKNCSISSDLSEKSELSTHAHQRRSKNLRIRNP